MLARRPDRLRGVRPRGPAAVGSFGVLPKKSCDRTTWECEQPGLGRLTGTERSVATARARRLLTPFDTVGEMAGALARSHFGFAREGEPVFSIDKPKVFDDWYRLSVHEEAVDRQLLFAPAVTMEARQRGQVRTSHGSTPTTQPGSRPSSPSTAGPVPPSSVTGPPTRPGFWSSTPIATLISRARRWSICGPRSKPATQRPAISPTSPTASWSPPASTRSTARSTPTTATVCGPSPSTILTAWTNVAPPWAWTAPPRTTSA